MGTNYAYIVADPTASVTYDYPDSGRRRFIGQDLFEYSQGEDGQTDRIFRVGNQQAPLETSVLVAERNPNSEDPPHDESYSGVLAATSQSFFVQKEENEEDTVIERWWVVNPDGSTSVVLMPEQQSIISPVADQRQQPIFRTLVDNYDTGYLELWNQPGIALVGSTPEADSTNTVGSTEAAMILASTANEREQPEAPDPYDVDVTSIGQHSADGGAVYFSSFGEPGDYFNVWDNATITWSATGGGSKPRLNLDIQQIEHIILDVPSDVDTDLPWNGSLQYIYHAAYALPAYTPGSGPSPISRAGQLVLVVGELNPPGVPTNYMSFVEASIHGTTTIYPTAPYAYRQGEYRFFNGVLDETSTFFQQGKGLPGSEVMHSDLVVQAGRGIYTAVMGLDTDADNYGGGEKFSVAIHFAPGESISGSVGPQRTRFTG